MNLSATRSTIRNPLESLARTRIRSTAIYSGIIILAMFAFEAFNYATTAYALKDLLGELSFAGLSWATLMALAFCGIDFAGIARLVSQKGRQENASESWYLFAAWLIAGTFNAALTWWGVSIAIAGHEMRSSTVVSTQSLTAVVPVLVAILVWVIRVLIIGMLSAALERANQGKPELTRRASAAVSPVGFSTPSQPSPKPQPMAYPARPAAASMNPRQAYRPFSSAPKHTPTTNEFMAAEQQSRNL